MGLGAGNQPSNARSQPWIFQGDTGQEAATGGATSGHQSLWFQMFVLLGCIHGVVRVRSSVRVRPFLGVVCLRWCVLSPLGLALGELPEMPRNFEETVRFPRFLGNLFICDLFG